MNFFCSSRSSSWSKSGWGAWPPAPPPSSDGPAIWKQGDTAGADLGILGGGDSGPEFFKGGGGVMVQVRGNFHLTIKKDLKKERKKLNGMQ